MNINHQKVKARHKITYFILHNVYYISNYIHIIDHTFAKLDTTKNTSMSIY